MKRKAFILLLIGAFLTGCTGSASSPGPPQTAQIGVILPITGNSPINGNAEKAAVEAAVEDVNAYLSRINSTTRVEVVIGDSQSMLDGESVLLDEMRDRKITVVATGMTSESLGILRTQIAANGTIIINEASTSPTLSANDNIFRLVPDDTYSARVMSDLLRENGIEKVIFYYRDDQWGTALTAELTAAFTASGGTVADSIVYSSRAYNADMDEKVLQLDTSVTQALVGTSTSKVAVILLAFEEGIDILKKAAAYPTLSTLKWYTGDGLGQSNDLLKDAAAAAFARTVRLYAPLIAEVNSAAYQQLKARIQAKTGFAPYAFAPVMYDAIWLAALTLAEPGSAQLKTTLLAKAGGYAAVSGPINLNAAGDRSTCAYDFWAVDFVGGTYQWIKAYSGRTR